MRAGVLARTISAQLAPMLPFLVLSLLLGISSAGVYEYPVRSVPLETPPKGFVRPNFTILLFIMESGHVGSTALTDMIGTTSVAVNLNECFIAQRTYRRTRDEEGSFLRDRFDNAATYWKEKVIDVCNRHLLLKPNATICVMKAMVDNLYPSMDFLLSIPPDDLFLVFLQRRNRVQKALSFFTAHAYSEACNRFHRSSRRTCKFPHPPLEFPLEAMRLILPYLEYLDAAANDTVSTVLKPYYRYTLDYEDWLSHTEETAQKVLEDVLRRPIGSERFHTLRRKMNPHRLRDAVSNFDELAEELRGTPYAEMLEHGGEEGYHTPQYMKHKWFEEGYERTGALRGDVQKGMKVILAEWMEKWDVPRGQPEQRRR